MNKRTSVVNISGDHEETLIQLARHLGRSKIRREVFSAVYGRGTRPKSKKQIMEAAGIPSEGNKSQQVQNELDHLAKHHLIVRQDNNGAVKDGSRYLYGKDETVRANRDRIIRFADDPKAANSLPTKRRPVIQINNAIKGITRRELRKRKKLNVLYLVASPDEASRLRVDVEVSKVQEQVRGTKFRDNISIEYRPAANLNTLLDGLNDFRPQIVHFSGHSNESDIAMDAGSIGGDSVDLVSYELLAKALAATDSCPEVVVLNSCKSSAAKKHLLPLVKIVIAMKMSISDIAAATFAPRFYAALASGQSVQSAFDQGKVAVEAASIADSDTPELLHAVATDPMKIILT